MVTLVYVHLEPIIKTLLVMLAPESIVPNAAINNASHAKKDIFYHKAIVKNVQKIVIHATHQIHVLNVKMVIFLTIQLNCV